MKYNNQYAKATLINGAEFTAFIEYDSKVVFENSGSADYRKEIIKGKDLITGTRIISREFINYNLKDVIAKEGYKKNTLYIKEITKISKNEVYDILKNMTRDEIELYVNNIVFLKNCYKYVASSINKKKEKCDNLDDSLKLQRKRVSKIAKNYSK